MPRAKVVYGSTNTPLGMVTGRSRTTAPGLELLHLDGQFLVDVVRAEEVGPLVWTFLPDDRDVAVPVHVQLEVTEVGSAGGELRLDGPLKDGLGLSLGNVPWHGGGPSGSGVCERCQRAHACEMCDETWEHQPP